MVALVAHIAARCSVLARRLSGLLAGLPVLAQAGLLVLVLPVADVPAASAPVTPAVVFGPPLVPAFDPHIRDYIVHCRPAVPMHLSFSVGPRVPLSLDGGRVRRGRVNATASLLPGQALRFVIGAGRGARDYTVRCLPPDFPAYRAQRTDEPQAGGYLVALCCAWNYAAIFDRDGVPVWWLREGSGVLDASLLPDGNVAIGLDAGQRLGQGLSLAKFGEFTLDGRFVRILGIPGGTPTDRHELQVLPNGDYVVAAHVLRHGVDLRPYGGPAHATVLDARVVEVSPRGRIVWQWDSKDHIGPAETGRWYRQLVLSQPARLADGTAAYDLVHINAVAPYRGGFLISLRHTDAVYAVDRRGRAVWKLGGTSTAQSLRIISDDAPDFGGQHDVRALPDGTITLHDNGTGRGRAPRALHFRIDAHRHTATMIERLDDHQTPPDSPCCGSARRLPGGDWVIDWGGQHVVTELTGAGRPVFTLRFALASTYRAVPATVPGRALQTAMDRQYPRHCGARCDFIAAL